MPHQPPVIAVVDDEADVRRALQRLLRAVGFEVQAYASGNEFMKRASAQEQDCVILDLHMAGMTGFEVQEALAANATGIPVIVITGYDTPAARARALGNGARAYLCKPVDDEVLLRAIAGAIGAAEMPAGI